MAIKVTVRDIQQNPIVLNAFREHEDGYFWIHTIDDDEKGVRIDYPYGSKPDYSPEDTELLFLLNPFQGEAAVMEAVTAPKTHRIGYVCSILSIGSKNHEYSECPYFRKASYGAAYKMIERFIKSELVEVTLDEIQSTTFLEELFGFETVILSIHKPFAEQADVSASSLLSDLFRYGYTVLDELGVAPPLRLKTAEANFSSARANKRLALKQCPEPLASDGLIAKFIGQRLLCPSDPVLRFFYLYQIVERVLDLELQEQLKNLSSEVSSDDLNSLRVMDAFHSFKDALSEKNRMQKIFSEGSNNIFDASPAVPYFVGFLKECGIDADCNQNYGDLLYKVRNTIFHGWWRLSADPSEKFIAVVSELENDIPEFVINYRSYR